MANLDRVLKGLRRRRDHLQPVEARLIGNSRKSSLVMSTAGIERKRERQKGVLEECRRFRVGRRELQAALENII